MKNAWRSSGVAAALIILLTFLAYIPALRCGFVWDDDNLLLDNHLIRASDGLYRFWCTTQPTDYWPLTSTTWWLEWRLWGKNPLGYHLVNVILHALSAVLWWRILTRLKFPAAWLAAALFAVHPVNVESVAWIAERKNTLSMFLYALTLLWYLRFEDTDCRRWYWLAVGIFALALLSKTSVVLLPLVLMLCAWWRRGKVDRNDLLRLLPFFALSVAAGFVTVWFQSREVMAQEVLDRSLAARVAGAGWACWFYVWKALVPVHLMTIYPSWNADMSSPLAWLPSLIALGCIGIFWRYRQGWGRPLLFASGYFLAMLFPVLGIIDLSYLSVSPVADRFLYFSLIGVIALVVTAGARMCRTRQESIREMIQFAAVVVVVLLVSLTWRQNRIYKDQETLWTVALERNPGAWVAHNGLGVAFQERDPREAISHFELALRLKPDYAEAHNNLGNTLLELGDASGAVAQFEQALRLQPNSARMHYNLGGALIQQGRRSDAIGHWEQALRADPDYAEAHNNLAAALMQTGQLPEAIDHLKQALRIDPDYAEAHNNLAAALMQTGKLSEAIAHWEQAVRIKPDYAQAHKNLGTALMQTGAAEAVTHLDQALRIKPDYAQAHKNLGNALLSLGKVSEARGQYEQVLRLTPDDVEVQTRLAHLRAAQ
jgi:tetratricopeptide (TPR) repeat protein